MNEKFFFNPSDSGDNKKRFDGMFIELKAHPGSTLVIAPGIYEVSTELSRQTLFNVMNGVYGDNPEKAMFKSDFPYSKGLDISGLKDVTVEAYGVKILIDGFMEPVSVRECENITIKGLTVDHKRKPYSRGIITKTEFTDKTAGKGFLTVEFSDKYPIDKNTPMPKFCIFDCNANRFAHYGEAKIGHELKSEIAPQIWKLSFSNLHEDVTGNELYVWHTFHSRPAVLIENCKNTRLECVTVHSQPGMGVIAHRCENLVFERLHIIPSAGEHMSTNTDATHVTSCKGKVEYSNCWFDGQGDDAANVHTYYHKIIKSGGNTCRITLDAPTGTHSQSSDSPEVGDELELCDIGNLSALCTYRVVKCTKIDVYTDDVVLDKSLPEDCTGLYFANITRSPDLYFHDCVCHGHLARGVLSKTKRAVIEDNRFIDVVGTAIYVTAEGYWREGICTSENVIIRRNHISFCGRTNSIRQANCAGITVTLSALNPCSVVHKSITITDNIVDCPHSPYGIYVSNTEKLILERNSVISRDEPIKVEEFAVPDN